MSETPLIGPHSRRSAALLPQNEKKRCACAAESEQAHAQIHDLKTQQRKRSWNNEQKNTSTV